MVGRGHAPRGHPAGRRGRAWAPRSAGERGAGDGAGGAAVGGGPRARCSRAPPPGSRRGWWCRGSRSSEVGGTPDLRAPRRAEAAGLRIAALAASEEPVPELAVERRGQAAAGVSGKSELMVIRPAEAAACDTTAEALAAERAAVPRAGGGVRSGSSAPGPTLRLLGGWRRRRSS